jgi:Zn-dependent M28 family amino/carboxypeptidase
MSSNDYDEQEGFLARWSRRKARSLRGEELPEPEPGADEEEAAQASGTADATPDEVEEAAAVPDTETADAEPEALPELPSLDSLGADSDYSAFMREGVPSDLRQKALRKLFHSPKFNIRDGLDDYDWDMSSPAPLGDIITAEMRYRVERELKRLAGLDADEQTREDAPAMAAAGAGEHDTADDPPDPEADDERTEAS